MKQTIKALSKEDQKRINPKTRTGDISFVFGFNGCYTHKNGKKCGGGSFLQLDGTYGPNPVSSIYFTEEILKKINGK